MTPFRRVQDLIEAHERLNINREAPGAFVDNETISDIRDVIDEITRLRGALQSAHQALGTMVAAGLAAQQAIAEKLVD